MYVERAVNNIGQLIPITSPAILKTFTQKVPLTHQYIYLYAQEEESFLHVLNINKDTDWFSEWLGKDYPLNKYSKEKILSVDYQLLAQKFNKAILYLFRKEHIKRFIQYQTQKIKKSELQKHIAQYIIEISPNFLRIPYPDRKILEDNIFHLMDKKIRENFKLLQNINITFFLKASIKHQDEHLLQFLSSQDSKLTDNFIHTPQYQSWAKVESGIKIVWKNHDFNVEYIPYKQSILPLAHNISIQQASHCDIFETAQFDYVIFQHNQTTQTLFNQIFERYFMSSQKEEYEFKTSSKTVRGTHQDIFGCLFKDEMKPQDLFYLQTILKNWNHSSYPKIKTNYYSVNNTFQVYTTQKLEPVKQAKALHFSRRILQILKKLSTQSLEGITEEFTHNIKQKQQLLYSFLEKEFIQTCDQQLTQQQNTIIQDFFRELSFHWAFHNNFLARKQEKVIMKNKSPISEQGKLTIRFKDPKKLPEILNQLAHIGIISSYHKPPQEIGYHHDICLQSKHIKLPKNHLVIHGLTGTDTHNQALHRLKQMVTQPGILSQSERRRKKLEVYSMSPIGDIVSGLDWAVPATINTYPSYGKHIFFVVSPSVLQRQHLFFAPCDFGGGKNRFHQYNDYAKSLGQTSFLEAISPQHKTKHLNNIQNMPYNEVWFKHSLAWQEITHVLVSDKNSLHHKATKLLQANPQTQHIQVVSYHAKRELAARNVPEISSDLKQKLKNISKKIFL